MLRADSELLYNTDLLPEEPSVKEEEEEEIFLRDLSHGFIHNAPSVPGW